MNKIYKEHDILKADILDMTVFAILMVFTGVFTVAELLSGYLGGIFMLAMFVLSLLMEIKSIQEFRTHKELCITYDKVEATAVHQDRLKRLEAKKRAYLDRPNEETFSEFENYRKFCEDQMAQDIQKELRAKNNAESILNDN